MFGLVKTLKVERILYYSKQEIYEIVKDIDKYKEFVPGIKESRIFSSKPIKAELVFGLKGIESRFISNVILEPHHTISATSYSLDAIGNLGFKTLQSSWKFTPKQGKTLVKLEIQLEFNNFLVAQVTGMMMDNNVEGILNAFEKRAQKLYSKKH
jgi:coenzyme Q-binding protein COQ10